MISLNPNYHTLSLSNPQLRQSHQHQQQAPHSATLPRSLSTSIFYVSSTDSDTAAFDLDLDSDNQSQSLSSSPQSLVSQYPLSTFDSIPAVAVPRAAQNMSSFFTPTILPQMSPSAEMAHTDTWFTGGQSTPKSAGRLSHHREESLSSLGSAGPASPFSFNTSNPQIAVTDLAVDNYHGLPVPDDQNYQFGAKPLNSNPHDALHSSFASYTQDHSASVANFRHMMASQRQGGNRGSLLPPPELSASGSNRSRPVSLASSVASDSPATPSAPEPEEDRRRKKGFNTVPKLDRTMTDVYSDELYSPNFTYTSASPSQPGQAAVSPTNEMFVRALQAANNQHLSAGQSPVPSSTSRGRSPFRQGSPLAPVPIHDFHSVSASAPHFNRAPRMTQQRTVEQDAAQARRQVMAQASHSGTPQTISPKDAVLEFSDPGGESDVPLFPTQKACSFGNSQIGKPAPGVQQNFGGLPLETSFDFIPQQLSAPVQIPQQYPFISQPRHEPSSAAPTGRGSFDSSPRVPSEATSADSTTPATGARRPENTLADGGTYTCTYHGCTLRFETPAALQKHKREGHRQTHGMNGIRGLGSPTTSILNTQAGPHRCDRINPSTGKPCNTVFSRPYDLTRHEDTIHNARKQKVRCGLCTEEKTFSRADALTRHYRVCHPDVELPGKHRRRGGSSA